MTAALLFIAKVACALLALVVLRTFCRIAKNIYIEKRQLCFLCARKPLWIVKLSDAEFRMCDGCLGSKFGKSREWMWERGNIRHFVKGAKL